MAKRNLFGTDGVRGVVNVQITSKLALSLGAAGSIYFGTHCPRSTTHKVAIAWDPRVSSEMLAAALGAGFMETGVAVEWLGVLPTPGLALLLAADDAYMAGAMISASHNPPEYNGIKFFGPGGRKLDDDEEALIEANIGLVELGNLPKVRGDEVGTACRTQDARERYLDLVKDRNRDVDLKGLKIVVDTAHGATSHTTPVLLRELGAEVVAMNTDEVGVLVNKDCGSTHPEALEEHVIAEGADLGIAHDGDGDRVIMVDRRGRRVSGDLMLYVLATGLERHGQLKGKTVVGTVLTNLGLEQALARGGIQLQRTNVGDRYILDRLHESDFVLGGEESGHVINLYQNVTGDGLTTALAVLRYLKETGKDLSEIVDEVELYPQVAENVRVKDKAVANAPAFLAEVERVRTDLGPGARLVVRPSGTEPFIRIFLEGRDTERLKRLAQHLKSVLLDINQ